MTGSGPSKTAQYVALARAALASRPAGRILADPYASRILPFPVRAVGWSLRTPLSPWAFRAVERRLGVLAYIAVRTLFLDQMIDRARARGIRQVVVVGGGYDTRSLRLAGRDMRFFEVDHPATQRDKRACMRRIGREDAACWIAADLTRVDLAVTLERAGLDVTTPTCFVWEGVTMYLSEPELRRTARALAAVAAPGSALGLDAARPSVGAVDPELLARGKTAAAGGEAFDYEGSPEELAALLAEEGWRVRETLAVDDAWERYLRGSVLRQPSGSINYLVEAAVSQGSAKVKAMSS